MRAISYVIVLGVFTLFSCTQQEPRTIEDFNFDWKFSLGEQVGAELESFDDTNWESIRLPHDWSNVTGYTPKNTAASTGFVEGGMGWYRKTFNVPTSDKGKTVWVEFDGVFCNSTVWVNGKKLGFRPNGYASFSYDLSKYLNYGAENVIAVKVDHSNYADTRWYTGSGIYRDVRLVKTSAVHIPQWGVRITTPKVSTEKASVTIDVKTEGADNVEVAIAIYDEDKNLVVTSSGNRKQQLEVPNPQLWGIDHPHLYTAVVSVIANGKLVDKVEERFGIRTFKFDSEKGFSLNGAHMKIKGVNIHLDLGAVGTAGVKANWEYRVEKLKSVGVNAIRMAHNPHSTILMDVCDEQGMLVMNEFFDEWQNPKGKSVNYLGDEAATPDIDKGYSDVFFEWAEKDLKTLISRDFNRPSVIMWSIGNEIEWTFPYYSRAFGKLNTGIDAYRKTPSYDTVLIKKTFRQMIGGDDSLALTAKQLAKWVKEEDTTRSTICGSVIPSFAMMSGYGEAVDILGLNYRAADYDAFHKTFPDKPILGSENWVAYSEWEACVERDFVAGIFVWTGFAYRGEAGPWPRKGLDISLFDFAGFKTPRGHFFECLWKDDPKVYMVTTPASESEFSYTDNEGWKFEMQLTPPPVWNQLRRWEWYKVNEHWNYTNKEKIVVQAYTNCEEAELFLNGNSLGKQALADFAEEDNIIKWLVPFSKGELKVLGYNEGKAVKEYVLNSTSEVARIKLSSNKTSLKADNYDAAHLTVTLYDASGNEIKDLTTEISFEVHGAVELWAVDNGWEMNVDSHLTNTVKTHKGRALAIIRAKDKVGNATISASIGTVKSEDFKIELK